MPGLAGEIGIAIDATSGIQTIYRQPVPLLLRFRSGCRPNGNQVRGTRDFESIVILFEHFS